MLKRSFFFGLVFFGFFDVAQGMLPSVAIPGTVTRIPSRQELADLPDQGRTQLSSSSDSNKVPLKDITNLHAQAPSAVAMTDATDHVATAPQERMDAGSSGLVARVAAIGVARVASQEQLNAAARVMVAEKPTAEGASTRPQEDEYEIRTEEIIFPGYWKTVLVKVPKRVVAEACGASCWSSGCGNY
ncbi:MAG: hypothetical protein AB7F19_01620 [Candidatus Babeliales bacterium]